jgi:predicted outer membrane repeat protein
VWIVDAIGGGDFSNLQTAVSAASNGDTLLVKSGAYAGFTVDQKSVWIIATSSDAVTVAGTVEIKNLGANQSVLLSGLTVSASSTTVPRLQRPGLNLSNNVGHVRARNCSFTGADGIASYSEMGNGGSGADIANCLSVAFVSCMFQGGVGKSACDDFFFSCGAPYDRGGHGVWSTLSIAAFYDCTLKGGDGGYTEYYGPSGDGGNGCDLPTFAVFASGSRFIGGKGGHADDFLPAEGGDGGHGVRVAPGARAFLLENVHTGGAAGGSFIGPPGSPGLGTTGGGIFNDLNSTKRLCSSAVLAASGDTLAVTFEGEPGDRVYLPTHSTSHWQLVKLKFGVWLLPVPVRLDHTPIAVLPASGTAVVHVPMPNLAASESMRQVFAQAVFLSAQGQSVVGAPLHFAIANCATMRAPDCNSNNVPDLCDVFSGDSDDCNDDFVPDDCEVDCNENGDPDVCDIASGASKDANRNAVPDDCEDAGAVWYVDASASPGGDGSFASPFSNIADAVDVSIDGNTIRVRDGVYAGAPNSGIVLSGRILRVESVNGPASCIIDVANTAAFRFLDHHDNQAATVSGFTLRNGFSSGIGISINQSSPTIENCVFEDFTAPAINALYTSSTIRGCTFSGNGSNVVRMHSRFGAGHAPCAIIDCVFVDNVGQPFVSAGTLRVDTNSTTAPPLVSHCTFIGNNAGDGGAIFADGEGVAGRIENCLFVGNSTALWGGAIRTRGRYTVENCTFVGNTAAARGGAVAVTDAGEIVQLTNCVIWGNSAPTGPQLWVGDTANELIVRYCTVEGGQSGVSVFGSSVLTWGPGSLSSDPLFVDADGLDNNALTYGDNDYRLMLASPCVDAGDTSALPLDFYDLDGDLDTSEILPVDLDFNARRVNVPAAVDTGVGPAPVVDIGAYERQ